MWRRRMLTTSTPAASSRATGGSKMGLPNGHPAAHHWRGTIEATGLPQGGARGGEGGSDRGEWGVQSGLRVAVIKCAA